MIKCVCFRQNGADASSEEFDSSSSLLGSVKPQSRLPRRSRSYSRTRERGRTSDSSTTAIRKKTTFITENHATLEEDNVNGAGGSIKSSSSYDASKISFQGKRALFEARPIPATHSALQKSQENLDKTALPGPPNEVQSKLEEANRRLTEEVARLEQALILREEAARGLRERLESQLGEREEELQRDVRRLVRDNTTKEEIIQ